jgi:hypothetical protein
MPAEGVVVVVAIGAAVKLGALCLMCIGSRKWVFHSSLCLKSMGSGVADGVEYL